MLGGLGPPVSFVTGLQTECVPPFLFCSKDGGLLNLSQRRQSKCVFTKKSLTWKPTWRSLTIM
ncbi:hypothetical protein DESC_500140 [Desulfosarcina cetonica]|nr:hypothetical protein DESC_500140 [Desulfosarcina cetonica]